MDEILAKKLIFLADKYENLSFCDEDPSQFLRWYNIDTQIADVEVCSFIAAMIAFGNRKQFIPKIKEILELADKNNGIASWIKSGAKGFPKGSRKFYRFYSYDDFHCFFNEISLILKDNQTLGLYFEEKYKEEQKHLCDLISDAFPNSKIVPKGKASAKKRINMFLRWMIRKNSSVDLGIWNWFSEKDLIIPLDIHVLNEAISLGLLSEKSTASRKNAVLLTEKMSQIFVDDPCRADFALFGLGVDTNR